MELRGINEEEVFALVLGKVIAALRTQRKLSQLQLAEAIGISQPVVSRIESGKAQPDAYLYGRLALSLGTDVQGLNHHVEVAMAGTRRAAEAATQKKAATSSQAWSDAVAVAGIVGLIGLIAFAVAAALSAGDGKPGGPKKPGPGK